MKKLLMVFLSFFLCFFFIHPALAIPVYIENYSFESNQPEDGGWASDPVKGPYITQIDGWAKTGSTGTWQPTTGPTDPYPGGVPDGINVAFSNGGTISQTLAEALTANYQYTLQVYVGNRTDTAFQDYFVELWAGELLAFENSLVPADGEFLSSIVYTAVTGDSNIGNFLEIRLWSDTGAQVNFDLVTLDASPIPEPATILFLGSGIIGLAKIRRKSKKY